MGSGLFKKTVFYKITDSIDEIIAITATRFNDKELIAIFGGYNIQLVDAVTARPVRRIDFTTGLSDPQFFDIDEHGNPQIVGYGDYSFPDVVYLLDVSGAVIWKQPRKGIAGPGVAVGDLDRDKKPEIYFSDGWTVERLDAQGRTIWRKPHQPGNSYSGIDLYDPIGADDKPFLFLYRNRSVAEFYDHSGKLVSSRALPNVGLNFRLVQWPVGDKRARLVTWLGRTITVMDMKGGVEFQHTFPRTYPDCLHLAVTLVKFREDEAPLLAVLVRFGNYKYRSMLCIFSLTGKLLYEEGLGKTRGLLATQLPGKGGAEQVLLVGDRDNRWSRVVKYELAGSQ